MKERAERTRCMVEIALLIVISAAIYVGTCSTPALFDEADASNAEAGYQMVRYGDWLTPHTNYVPRLNKPPVAYWLIALSYESLGVSEFSARLPFALMAVGTGLVVFGLGNLLGVRRAGFYSGIAFATSLGPFVFTRTIAGDIVFTFFLSLGFYLFLRSYLGLGGAACMLGFYASMALAVMSKGLLALVFPVLLIGSFLLVRRESVPVGNIRPLPGLAVFLLIVAPWHVAVGLTHPGFFYDYFVNEHVLRFLGRHYPRDFESVPVWQFWLIQMAGLFPWIVFLPRSKAYMRDAAPRQRAVLTFLLLWAGVVMLFFTLSSRLEHYAMPAYPAVAAVVGIVLAKVCEQGTLRGLRGQGRVMLAVGVISAVATALVLVLSQMSASTSGLMGAHGRMTFFAPLRGLSTSTADHLLPETAVFGGTLMLIGLLGYLAIRSDRMGALVGVSVVGMMAVFGVVQAALVRFEPYLSLKNMAERIDRQWEPGAVIVAEGYYFNVSSIGFYTRRPILRWRAHPEWDFGSRFEGSRRMYIDDRQLARLWDSKRRVFLVADVEGNPESVQPRVRMMRIGDHVLLSNRADGGAR